jgi:hypothetical protein
MDEQKKSYCWGLKSRELLWMNKKNNYYWR